MLSMGSPGTRRSSKKITTDTARKTGTSMSRRLIRKDSTWDSQKAQATLENYFTPMSITDWLETLTLRTLSGKLSRFWL